jgi:hypothetical protein
MVQCKIILAENSAKFLVRRIKRRCKGKSDFGSTVVALSVGVAPECDIECYSFACIRAH